MCSLESDRPAPASSGPFGTGAATWTLPATHSSANVKDIDSIAVRANSCVLSILSVPPIVKQLEAACREP